MPSKSESGRRGSGTMIDVSSYRKVLAVVKVRSKATTTTAVWVKCLLIADASDDLPRFAVILRSACSEIAHAFIHSVIYLLRPNDDSRSDFIFYL